jgi:hypothetical protein
MQDDLSLVAASQTIATFLLPNRIANAVDPGDEDEPARNPLTLNRGHPGSTPIRAR